MTISFAVTWDYRCPFARNFHDHMVAAIQAGADWKVHFVPFSLTQTHRDENVASVWDDPTQDSGLLALQVGVLVRDEHPETFPLVHRDLFAVRHDEGNRLTDASLLAAVVSRHNLDGETITARAIAGEAIDTIRSEHERAVNDHGVWGVPTVIAHDAAVFIRLMDRSNGDAERSRLSIERAVSLLGCWPELNEFKHVSIPR